MKLSELRRRADARHRRELARTQLEIQVIRGLPDGPDYLRITPPLDILRPETTGVEIEVDGYSSILHLCKRAELTPLPLCNVRMTRADVRGGEPTFSFIPAELLPARWNGREDVAVVNVAPVVMQVQPDNSSGAWRPKVYFEWYARVNSQIVNVRAIIRQHDIRYELPFSQYKMDWLIKGLPPHLPELRRETQPGGPNSRAPKCLTIWWPEGAGFVTTDFFRQGVGHEG
jgi:hypothetical protein